MMFFVQISMNAQGDDSSFILNYCFIFQWTTLSIGDILERKRIRRQTQSPYSDSHAYVKILSFPVWIDFRKWNDFRITSWSEWSQNNKMDTQRNG